MTVAVLVCSPVRVSGAWEFTMVSAMAASRVISATTRANTVRNQGARGQVTVRREFSAVGRALGPTVATTGSRVSTIRMVIMATPDPGHAVGGGRAPVAAARPVATGVVAVAVEDGGVAAVVAF
jgi:hypothetical protein